jgi:hypothetical protein
VIAQETTCPETGLLLASCTVIDKGVLKTVPATADCPAPTGVVNTAPVEEIQVIGAGEVSDKFESVTSTIDSVVVPVVELDLILNVAIPEAFVTEGDVVIVSPV